MSRDERRGLFRGAEFSRLLILAGLLVVGWPLVLYYGFARPRTPAPKPAPIASQPPLPPADEAPELADLRDQDWPSIRDDPAKAFLLGRVRETPAATLAAEARREVLPLNLLKNPKRFRGLPIHLDGYAAQVFAVDDIDPEVTPKRRLYEVWMRTLDHDQRVYPVCLISEAVPPSLPGGKDLGERIAFDGYFLKLVLYRAGDGVRFAPVLIGRLAHYPESADGAPRAGSRFWTFFPLVLLFGYVSVRVLFTLRKNLAPKRARGPGAPPAEHIEPERLEEWLRSPPPDGGGGGPREE